MKNPSDQRFRQLQNKMHGFTLGMTLGLGSMYIGQVCPTFGQ